MKTAKTVKKITALLLFVCCILATSMTAYASDIQPMSEIFTNANVNLTISTVGQASCSMLVRTRFSAYHIEVTMSLNQINGKTPLKSWSLSGTGSLYDVETYYVTRGYDYQATADITVRDSSGKLIESFIVSSSIVHY